MTEKELDQASVLMKDKKDLQIFVQRKHLISRVTLFDGGDSTQDDGFLDTCVQVCEALALQFYNNKIEEINKRLKILGVEV